MVSDVKLQRVELGQHRVRGLNRGRALGRVARRVVAHINRLVRSSIPFTASNIAECTRAATRDVTIGFVPAVRTAVPMMAFHSSTGSVTAAAAGLGLATHSIPTKARIGTLDGRILR